MGTHALHRERQMRTTTILAGPLVPRHALRSLSDTVAKSGSAMRTTGQAIGGLSSVPFVGGDVARVARRVTATGASAEQSGRSSRSTVDRLAILLGIAVGLIPTVPVVVLYVLLSRAVVVRESTA